MLDNKLLDESSQKCLTNLHNLDSIDDNKIASQRFAPQPNASAEDFSSDDCKCRYFILENRDNTRFPWRQKIDRSNIMSE